MMETIMADNPTRLWQDKAIGAILGAACGDALGWPNERIGRTSSKRPQPQGSLPEFKKWTRRSGGRFYLHEEIINAGEYSDDTQLILCLSRSYLRGEKWWEYWTHVELPFWMLYERGGGGATKRAADAWSGGNSPWTDGRNQEEVKRYFEAGGNGVAMRVLPHILHEAGVDSFVPAARNIFLDGIATHGHPKALVGALAYGYALWKSFRRDSRLEYGAIVEELLLEISEWSRIPQLSGIPHAWLSAARRYVPGYETIWAETVLEMEKSLLLCRSELSKGAFTFEDEVLQQLHCFDEKVSGAGTVAAAASIFLASRYAPDPINGVIKAAFAIGSDTDTIASMTGGLLGVICGSDWLSSHKSRIQDSKYLVSIVQHLTNPQMNKPFSPDKTSNTHSHLRYWLEGLIKKPEGSQVELPDERTATVVLRSVQIGRSGKYKIEFRKLSCDDGQTIYLSKISKGSYQESTEKIEQRVQREKQSKEIKGHGWGVKIPVMSFDKSIRFYRDFLGLSIKKQTQDMVVFDQGLVLVPSNYASDLSKKMHIRSLIYIQATDIEGRFSLAEKNKVKIITQLAPWSRSGMLFFRCLDPEKNVVEVFAANVQ